MQRAVIYARFSSQMQREESIEAQVRACRAYCRQREYLVTHIYTDQAKSGRSTAERDEYNAMLKDAELDLFDVVVMHKIDRNARNEFDYFTFKQKMLRLGIRYEYSGQSIDMSPEGQMMESVIIGMSSYYSRNLSKETKKGLNENAYKAQFNGGNPPFGYDVDENKHYVINEREAEAVRMIFDMYADGKGYAAITHVLNAKGYRTKAGRPFGKSSLFDVLRNEKYIGVYTFNSVIKAPNGTRNTHGKPSDQLIRLEDAIPAIVDKATFHAVQEIRKRNKGCAMKFKARREYLLTGKIFCGMCGSAMNGHTVTKDGKVYAYYTCSQKERTASKCTTPCVNAVALENWVLDNIEQKILAPESIKSLSDKMAQAYAEQYDAKETHFMQLQKEQIENKAKLNKMLDMFEIIGASDMALIDRYKVLSARQEEVEAEIKAMVKQKPLQLTEEQIAGIFEELKQALHTYHDIETKRTLVSIFVKKITVTSDNVTAIISTQTFADKMVPRTRVLPIGKFDVKISIGLQELKAV